MAMLPERDLHGHAKYTWLQCLGEGAFGAVGLCAVKGTDEKVAVKFIPIAYADKNTWREVMNHRRLRHSHIIEFKEVFLTTHHVCIAMEYVNNSNLFNYVKRRGKLQEALARWFFQQLIMAVDYCHQKGVVNRDIKLENTLLQALPNKVVLVKLCDFGYSKADDQSEPKSKVGTSSYLAPEVIKSEDSYDGQMVDIWSCAVMLYIMLFGKYPFQPGNVQPGDDPHTLMMLAILQTQFAIPIEVNVSKECCDFLGKLFVKDPSQRIKIADILRHPWFTQGMPADALALNQQCLKDTSCSGFQSEEEITLLLASLPKMQVANSPHGNEQTKIIDDTFKEVMTEHMTMRSKA